MNWKPVSELPKERYRLEDHLLLRVVKNGNVEYLWGYTVESRLLHVGIKQHEITHWCLITPSSEPATPLVQRLIARAAIEGDLDLQVGPSAETLACYQSDDSPDPAAVLAEALEGLLDEPCRYDHNEFCQEHYCSKPCKHEVARAALETWNAGK